VVERTQRRHYGHRRPLPLGPWKYSVFIADDLDQDNLNSRPLDPQIGGLVVSCDPELRFKDCGGG
jgi:hypothetical protein